MVAYFFWATLYIFLAQFVAASKSFRSESLKLWSCHIGRASSQMAFRVVGAQIDRNVFLSFLVAHSFYWRRQLNRAVPLKSTRSVTERKFIGAHRAGCLGSICCPKFKSRNEVSGHYSVIITATSKSRDVEIHLMWTCRTLLILHVVY